MGLRHTTFAAFHPVEDARLPQHAPRGNSLVYEEILAEQLVRRTGAAMRRRLARDLLTSEAPTEFASSNRPGVFT